MKLILTILLSTALFSAAFAGNTSSSASQTIQLTLAPAIEISNNLQVLPNSNNSYTVRSNSGLTVSVANNAGNDVTTNIKNLLANDKPTEETFAVNHTKNNAGLVYTATQP